ncbi:MAG: exodeoxyribonuclease VII small subunit [Candidatus Saccharibacteria bacterium]
MTSINYQKTKLQLDELLSRFEADDITIEEAIDNYKKAQVLISKLESYLSETKSKIIKTTKRSN